MTVTISQLTERDPAATEWDHLTAALNQWGILHVGPGAPVPVADLSARELVSRLLRSAEPRLHQAVVPFLLTHPEMASDAQAAIATLPEPERDRGMRRYVAAAALQRLARTRIALALGDQPLLPPAYVSDLGLPSLDAEFGRETLLALSEQERQRHGYDAWGTYLGLFDLFLTEIENRRLDWGTRCASAPTKRG